MTARTIDEVIGRLEAIIEESAAGGDRAGYFAALYNRVTLRVKSGIAGGEFDDGPRMERLDVAFANRYLGALDAWRGGQAPGRSWLAAFEGSQRGDLTVLQHLVLGMNAHINLDLGVAAAQTCPGDQIGGLRGDFDRINQVLASLLCTVEGELDRLEPVLGFAAKVARGAQDHLADALIDEARDGAWRFATSLAALPSGEQQAAIRWRDLEVTALADGVLVCTPLARLLGRGEGGDVGQNIRLLSEGEFTFRLGGPP